MEIEELKKELEKLKDLKIYVFEGEVYVKVEDYREKTIENRELKEENRLLKNEIAWLKDHTKYNYLKDELYVDGTMTATEAKLRLEQARQNQIYLSNLEEENRKLKDELDKIKKRVKEHTTYSVKAEFIKKFLD